MNHSVCLCQRDKNCLISTCYDINPLFVRVCVCFSGDYFGILMDEKVTVFPFNIMENPMYWGSTANYLGLALM